MLEQLMDALEQARDLAKRQKKDEEIVAELNIKREHLDEFYELLAGKVNSPSETARQDYRWVLFLTKHGYMEESYFAENELFYSTDASIALAPVMKIRKLTWETDEERESRVAEERAEAETAH